VQAKPLLANWPNKIQAYLESPADNILPIIDLCRQPAWGHPLSDDAAKAMVAQLAAGSTAEVDEEAEEEAYSRPKVANPEDVLLNIPEDINRDLLEAYLQETPQHAADFSAAIQNIIQGAEISEIERAQRIAHTLKGSSNIIGIKGIASIAHHLEDTLEYLAKHKVAPPKELTDAMVEAADCLEMMVDALVGREEAPEQAQQVLQTVLDWANRIDKGKLDAPPAPAATESAAPAAAAPPKAENKPKAGAAPEVTAENVLRVPTRTVDELMRLVGELSISVGQIQDKLKHVLQSTRLLTEQDLILQQKTFALENLVDVRGVTGIDTGYHKANITDKEDFDPLEFEEYNELHSVAHSFIESIADNRELALSIREELAELETMFIHQERINKEFQASIMTTRMVPVSTMLSKLQRNVRQTCRMTGKKAELEISGTDILIDSDVLTNLADPLQHILRNAIDHGLESPDDRLILGKSETGIINLSFYREGNNIVVKCQDDGQGLNYANIRFTAIQRGLITENQEMTEAELARLILMSGFSTKSGVTQVSGRGVGMDVVHTNIRQMKGTLDLFSETGKGTTILIKLPMTLVTVHVLLVRVGELRFGIPTNHLEQALAPGIGEYQKVGDEITLKIGKNLYAVKYLGNMLNVPGDKEFVDENDTRPIILTREETGITSVVVDELIDTHDLVMKSMGHYVKKIRGVSGAAILGDGSLIPLLDLPELLRVPMQSIMSSYVPDQGEQASMGATSVPHIMVVDDSLSVRKSLSLLLEEAGFDILLAKDGLEAIEIMNQTRPNVMLVDMEMPRMNGLELTAHVRANQATQNLPIFMITSRTTEKHREQAKSAGVSAYLTKPYQDTELLDLIDKALAGKIS
jgi:chemosensory pili system protein ChpA (sensor histidine kinase/response regulator)